MRHFPLAATLAIALSAPLAAHAQFGALLKDLGDKVQEKAQEVGQKVTGKPAANSNASPNQNTNTASKPAPSSKPSGDTHCRSGEVVAFNCSTGSKTVSFCADAKSVPQSLVYRYGKLGTPEIEVQGTAAQPFQFTSQAWDPRTSAEGVYFHQGDVSYAVANCSRNCGDDRSALMVFKNQKLAAKSYCVTEEQRNWPVDIASEAKVSQGVLRNTQDKKEPDLTAALFDETVRVGAIDSTFEADRITNANLNKVFTKLAALNLQEKPYQVPLKVTVKPDSFFKGVFTVEGKVAPKQYAYVRVECAKHSAYDQKAANKRYALHADNWRFNDGDPNAEVQVLTIVAQQCTLMAP